MKTSVHIMIAGEDYRFAAELIKILGPDKTYVIHRAHVAASQAMRPHLLQTAQNGSPKPD